MKSATIFTIEIPYNIGYALKCAIMFIYIIYTLVYRSTLPTVRLIYNHVRMLQDINNADLFTLC